MYVDHDHLETHNEEGRTYSAIRIQELKEANKKCANCCHYSNNKFGQSICKNKQGRRVEWYNICQLHLSPKRGEHK